MIEKIMNEPQPLPRKVPDYMRKKGGLWYWTGAMVMIALFYELLTGIILLFYYQPSNAYASTESFLNIPYGTIILTTHLYGAYIMIGLVYVHLFRNLFIGSYKKPREMQWIIGLLLLLLTLAVAFFGYSMSGDVLSSDATDVGRGIANGFPVIGSYLSSIFFGTGTSITLFSRLEGWHIILAGSILVLFAAHFFMSEYNTIMPSPKENNYRVPAVDTEKSSYKPWYPYNLLYMAEMSFFTLALIFIIPSVLALLPNVPALFSPFPQVAASSPLASLVPPYPPWFLLFVYKELDFQISGSIGPFWAVVLFTGLPLGYLLLVPFLDKSDTLKISRRASIVYLGILGLFYYIGLSVWGALRPGIPVSNITAFAFFAVPMLVTVPLVYLAISKIERSKLENGGNLWKIYSMLPITGFLSITTGIVLYESIVSQNRYYYVALIILIVFIAVSALYIYGWIYDIKRNEKSEMMSGRWHVAFGSVYAFVAVMIITIISSFPPTVIKYQALYGIGMGILLILAAAFVKLYRSYVYKE
jgi:quinol-cytochrome oxidoreductase complex cytochrome b subunit